MVSCTSVLLFKYPEPAGLPLPNGTLTINQFEIIQHTDTLGFLYTFKQGLVILGYIKTDKFRHVKFQIPVTFLLSELQSNVMEGFNEFDRNL